MEFRQNLLLILRCTCYAVVGFVLLIVGLRGMYWMERNLSEMHAWAVQLLVLGLLGWFLARQYRAETKPSAAEEPHYRNAEQRKSDEAYEAIAILTDDEVLQKIMEAAPTRPQGWFRWLHRTKHAWFLCEIYLDLSAEWRRIGHRLRENPAFLDEKVMMEVRRHAWLVGMLKLRHVMHAAWPHLNADVRGMMLAGLSEEHWIDKTMEERQSDSDWIVTNLADAVLTASHVAEIACSAIYQTDIRLLEAVLSKGKRWLDATVTRDDRDEWPEHLRNVSDRVIDMLLEASIFRCWAPGVSVALEHGADPNLHLWEQEDCHAEHYTTVGWVIDGGRTGGPDRGKVFQLLVDHPSFKPGPTHSKALWQAMRCWRGGSFQRTLLEKGVTFESSIKPPWLVNLPTDQEPDWQKCFVRMLHDRRASFEPACELARLLPLLSCHEASWFDSRSPRAFPTWETLVTPLLLDHRLDDLKKFAAAGLPLRLTFLDYLFLVHARSVRCLDWLMEQWRTPLEVRARALQIIIELQMMDARLKNASGEAMCRN